MWPRIFESLRDLWDKINSKADRQGHTSAGSAVSAVEFFSAAASDGPLIDPSFYQGSRRTMQVIERAKVQSVEGLNTALLNPRQKAALLLYSAQRECSEQTWTGTISIGETSFEYKKPGSITADESMNLKTHVELDTRQHQITEDELQKAERFEALRQHYWRPEQNSYDVMSMERDATTLQQCITPDLERKNAADRALLAAGYDDQRLEQYHTTYPPSEMMQLNHRINENSLTQSCLADLQTYASRYNAATQERSEPQLVASPQQSHQMNVRAIEGQGR